VVNCGFQGKRLHRVFFLGLFIYLLFLFYWIFPDEGIKITTEAEEGE
jgi:hypothetical protein